MSSVTDHRFAYILHPTKFKRYSFKLSFIIAKDELKVKRQCLTIQSFTYLSGDIRNRRPLVRKVPFVFSSFSGTNVSHHPKDVIKSPT